MKKVKKWIQSHLICLWVVSSVLFAIIIHILFSLHISNEWWSAKWSAGDILTYVSTVALGLLAVWQNKKFKEESDISQERMEKLTKQANELSAIGKIVEYETENILQLKSKVQDFLDACDIEKTEMELSNVGNQPNDFRKIYLKIVIDNQSKQIRRCGYELLTELKKYHTDVKLPTVVEQIPEYCKISTELLQELRNTKITQQTYAQKVALEKEFMSIISDFISHKEFMLNKVIYGNLSLDEIKDMYYTESEKGETK